MQHPVTALCIGAIGLVERLIAAAGKLAAVVQVHGKAVLLGLGGANIKGGLIGPGVAASHGMERTHIQAVDSTLKLIIAYLNAKGAK